LVEGKKEIVVRKKYTKKFLSSKSTRELSKFCQRKKIPYLGLNKKKKIENIQQWSEGATKIEDFKNKGLKDPNREPPKTHKLNIKLRRFCFEYSTKGKILTQAQWAKRFEVGTSTISNWLSWDETKALILTFQENFEKRMLQKFSDEEEIVFDELLKVIKQKRNSDVKRKAINDFFGYAGRINVNEKNAGTQVNIKQSQELKQANLTQNNINQMTEEEINKELKELENIEG
jgi:transposase